MQFQERTVWKFLPLGSLSHCHNDGDFRNNLMREEERAQILTRKTTKSYNDSSTMCGPVLPRLVRSSLHPLSPLVMDSTNKTVFLTSKFPCVRSLPVSTRTSYRPCPRRRTQALAFPSGEGSTLRAMCIQPNGIVAKVIATRVAHERWMEKEKTSSVGHRVSLDL